MHRAARIAKWGLIGVAGLLAAVAIAFALGVAWLNSDGGRSWLAGKIEDAASTPGEFELSIGAITGDLPHSLVARDIVLRDAEGTWLTVASLALEWRPGQLLRRTLEIERLSLGEVALARLPAAQPETEQDAAGGDLGSLLDFPLKVRVGALEADEIALAAPVLGQAAKLTLSGEAARRDDGSLSTRLDLARIDGTEEHVRAMLRYEPQDDSLTAEIDAASAPGGLVAALLDMPDLPGAGLTLTGSGPLADWHGDLSLALGDLLDARAALALRRAEGGDLGFRIDGSSEVSPPQDSDTWRLLAGRGEIAVEGAWQAGRRLHLDSLAFTNDSLRLGLAGDVVPESGALDLRATASTADADALARLGGLDRLGGLTADIAVEGSIGLPQVTLNLQAQDVASAAMAAETASLTGSLAAQRDLLGPDGLLALDLSGRLEAPHLPGQDGVNRVLGESLPLALSGELALDTLVLEIARLEATSDGVALSASGPFDLDDGSAQLQAAAEVAELGDLQPLTALPLGGSARLTGLVTLDGFGRRIAADLQGRWEQPASDIALIDAAAGEGLDVSARLVVEGASIRIEQAAVRSPTTEATVRLTIADGRLSDGRYSLRLDDAAVLAAALGVAATGPATAEGDLAGPFDALEIDGRAELAGLVVAQQRLDDIAATYRLRIIGPQVDGPVGVSLNSPFGPAEADADLQVRADAVTLADLQATLPETSVSGRVSVPLDGGGPAADLTAEVGDLEPWLEIAGLSGGGSGRVALTLNQPDAPAAVTASAELADVRLSPEPGAPPVAAEQVTIRMQGQDPAFAEPGRIDLAVSAVRWDRLTLEQVEATAEGTLDALAVSLNTRGRWQEPLELAAAARVTREGDSTIVSLERAEGRAFGQPLTLRQPARLTLTPTMTRLEGLALASGDARLAADAALGDGRISLDASLEALPLAVLDAFWSSGLDGRVSAQVTLDASPQDARGSAQLTAVDLRPRGSRDIPPLQLTTTADWQAGRLQARGEIGGAEIAAARFNADLPLQMTAEGGIEVPQQAPLSGSLNWSGDIKTVLLFVPLPQHRLSGRAEVALDVEGTPAQPRAGGHITLADGRYENLETGTVLRALTLRATVDDERVTLAELTANDGAEGRLSGSGSVTLDPQRDFPFDVAVQLDKFRAVHRDDVTAVTGGAVTLSGDATAPHVQGRFTTETIEVSLLADLPPNVVSLDVIEVRDGVVQQQPEAEAEASPIDATLDVVVEMPRRVFVRGRGLDSEWAGRISVQGPADSPAITGSLSVVRGQLSVVGKTFTLREGTVTLPEGAETEPALDVTAVHQGTDLTVTARLSGPLSQPDLELSSVPQVPRDEIVSRVLFDKSAAELSAAEAAQLAIALRDLTGRGGGTDILGFARRTLGVDVLRIETAEGDAPALEAGKYLSDRVYVGVKQGADPQSSAAGVEVELTPNVTLESEVTSKGANKSGIRFQWDY